MSEAHAKGSEGLLEVALELEKNGFITYCPFVSDHCKIDLIALKAGKLFTYQVKYAGSMRPETDHVRLDLNGSDEADYLAVYLPEQREVRFLPVGLLPKGDKTDVSLGSAKWRRVGDL